MKAKKYFEVKLEDSLLRFNFYSHKCNVFTPLCFTQIPEGGVDSLPANFFLNNLLSVAALHDESASSSVGCDICDSGDRPVNRCTTCSCFLCEFCTQAHLRARGTSSHGIVSIKEAKNIGSVAMAKPLLCNEHEGEVMKLFCATCNKAICRDCTVVEHREHEYTFVREAYSSGRESLLNIISETKTMVPMIEQALQSVSDVKTRVQCHAEQAMQNVTNCCDDLTACVNIRRQRLIQTAEEFKVLKLKALGMQQEELEMALASVKTSVEFTEKALKNGSKVEVLNMQKQLASRLEGFNSAKWQLKPCTDDIVKLNVNMNQLTQLMKNFGTIREADTSAGLSTVTMETGLEGVMYDTLCGEQVTFTIIAKEQNGKKRTDGGDIFEVEICHESFSNTERLKVKDCEDGTYTFCYTPRREGQFDLSVKLSDCHVQGSPFKFTAETLATRYGGSTLTLGNGEEGVMYNTLCGQPVEFTIKTKERKQAKKISSQRPIFAVEIWRLPSSRNSVMTEMLEVKDRGNGSYSCSYTPTTESLHQLLIKIEGFHIQGSPFEWKVEKWNLTVQPWKTWKSFLNAVDDNMRVQYIQNFDVWSLGIPSVLTALGSVGFSEGKHLWKVRMLDFGKPAESKIGIGVASSTEVRPLHAEGAHLIQHEWLWSKGPLVDHQTTPLCIGFTMLRFPIFTGNNDVIELYLDCDNGKLTICNPDTKSSSTTMGVRGQRLYPVFVMCSNGVEVSLRSAEVMTV